MDENAGSIMYQVPRDVHWSSRGCGCMPGSLWGVKAGGQYPDGGTAGSESLTHGPGVSATWDPRADPRSELGAKPPEQCYQENTGPWCQGLNLRCASKGLEFSS